MIETPREGTAPQPARDRTARAAPLGARAHVPLARWAPTDDRQH